MSRASLNCGFVRDRVDLEHRDVERDPVDQLAVGAEERVEIDILVPDREREREVVDRADRGDPVFRVRDVDEPQDASHARSYSTGG